MVIQNGILKSYQGTETEVIVGDTSSEEIITQIGDKAFLSCKTVQKLVLGDNVTEIGDWAFAHMQNLYTLILPCHKLALGKKVFLDCTHLTRIEIRGDESGNEGTPYLMASAVRIMKNEMLCKPEEAGNKILHKKWIREYDSGLLHFLRQPDEEGFEPVFMGWFHVEDMDEQIPRYLLKRRREKTELVYQRLLYSTLIKEETKQELYDYLRAHMPGGKEEKVHTLTFELMCEKDSPYSKDMRYLRIWEEGGFLSVPAMKLLLEKMNSPSPEVTAFLLRKQGKIEDEKDYFLALDLSLS